MISRKKIAELIEKESGCYVLNDGNIGYVNLKLKYEPELYVNGEDGYILYIYCNDRKEYKEEIFDEDLFETEEEANWHKEFGCIERTENLKLLPYEEICDGCGYDFVFSTPNHCRVTMFIGGNEIFMYKGISSCWSWELTKENYTLACRKAKELFLGGSDGDIR